MKMPDMAARMYRATPQLSPTQVVDLIIFFVGAYCPYDSDKLNV